MSVPPVLQVRAISKSFAGVKALEEVCLEIEAGQVHVVMGENGAGKSTLMKILAGQHQPDEGEILLQGRPLRLRDPHEARRNGIALIHQELMPLRDLSVAENIAIGREPCRWLPGWIDRAAMHREAREALAMLGVPIDPARRMGELSIAESQAVEIARALALKASVILMDEPTTALSEREVTALFRVIGDLKKAGVAIVYISHKMDEIFRVADTITVMRDGRHVATRPASQLDEPQLIRLMVGRDPVARSSGRAERGAAALEAIELTRRGAFEDISFTLHKGEILGVAGLMGAGRTELAHALYGMEPADAGQIRIMGRAVRIASPSDALAAGIALVGEDRKRHGFVPKMSIRANLTLSSLKPLWIDQAAERRLATERIEAHAIKAAHRDQSVETLSGGNQQKVVIARALLTGPSILILDEPTRGIDIGAKAEIHALISRLARSGLAVLLISSELPELLALSDRLMVMRQGRWVAGFDPLHTSQEEILHHAMPVT
ncbi:MAG TPA: sugar ABC transporter ATP-binding protein [Luteolibacter sp.]|nr:sugar ABC transporter ATP-binding protein [Luteolibacter sp.]